MTAIGRFGALVLDCPDARVLGDFYRAVLGWEIAHTEPDWVDLRSPEGWALAFQQVERHVAPVWPDADHPQQAHLDIEVDDLEAAAKQVERCGARRHDVQPGSSFIVFVDPAGHPFCLVQAGSYLGSAAT